MDRTVDYLINFQRVDEILPPPETPETPVKGQFADLPADLRREKFKELEKANRDAIEEIRAWWIRRMMQTKRPLQEKLTLFWHGHFTSSTSDVKSARHMLMQNEFLRKNCLGNFRDLLLGISRDPAMLRYLDNNTNRKQHPNENYARELMELFTMGIGNYTEDDVKAAARAFTGWTFEGDDFIFNDHQHDNGVKTFLLSVGDLDGTDVIDSILQQSCTARFMVAKLLRFFVSDKPEPEAVEEYAALLRGYKYDFNPFLHTLLSSEYFYSTKAYRAQIKSPTQLVVGACRLLGVTVNEKALAIALRGLGQDLLEPPNVKGWDGGETWINTTTLLERYNLSAYLLSGEIPFSGGAPHGKSPQARRFQLSRFGTPTNSLAQFYPKDVACDPAPLADSLIDRLLMAKLDNRARQWLVEQAEAAPVSERATRVAHLIMSMPDYQLC
jgi:uncharacterized protein (DUF1800 family)